MIIKLAINNIFNQLTGLIQELTNEEYSQLSITLNGSTIGQHVRHTLEFFKCLLQDYHTGMVNYDLRCRDLALESDTVVALDQLNQLRNQLNQVSDNVSITLEQSFDADETSCIVQSNLERELIYNIEHAVHHMALIRIGLREVKPNLMLDESFGIASSTMRYRASLLQKA
ncbi:DinB family protein [Reichenbachiella agarivorans]|uniref:DinB family protein n=1 Tax=Reichenbachiella agarivorans TaxID=2979464 RepID=A0ABY6CT20_9BACT|nr:DinB family protein [Reichenbachiella agarivorans]UXP32999.1 DinB family protein [Reichenbachiella agarivorans]